MMKKLALATVFVILAGILLFTGCGQAEYPTTTTTATHTAVPTYTTTATTTATATTAPRSTVTATMTAYPESGDTIGLSVGGAKDVANFRENIANGYLPLPTDITYEGLFYDYYFETGMRSESRHLYNPSYCYAVTRDPLSGEPEYYLAVGLNSGMKEEDFARKQLNLVIVLDISGSMNERYDQYYYDGGGNRYDAYEGEGLRRLTKMESAAEAVVAILDQLDDDDRFGIVAFNSSARVVQQMESVRSLNMNTVKNRILDINAGGNTNMSAGMETGTSLFNGCYEASSYEYENRIMVITDAQPNTGDVSSSGMMGQVRTNADHRIYSTFIGIGVDFNSSLIEQISKVRGANYYSVHSPSQFRERVDEEFDFMVTPLIFNLTMDFVSDGWRIEKVFGSPEADQATGRLMTINTLFPSRSVGGQTRGGLVLLKLRRMSAAPGADVYLRVVYEDRNGYRDVSEEIIVLESRSPEYFDNSGIRKGILLTRYAALVQNWLIDEYRYASYSRPWDASIDDYTGIVIPPESSLGQWERRSMPLTVSEPYHWVFSDFARYFEGEMSAIGDYSLVQELDILEMLADK